MGVCMLFAEDVFEPDSQGAGSNPSHHQCGPGNIAVGDLYWMKL